MKLSIIVTFLNTTDGLRCWIKNCLHLVKGMISDREELTKVDP